MVSGKRRAVEILKKCWDTAQKRQLRGSSGQGGAAVRTRKHIFFVRILPIWRLGVYLCIEKGINYSLQKNQDTMLDVKALLAELGERMEMSVMHLEETLSQIRAGRANVHILDGVRIDYYGQMSPLNVAASITTPDARTIAIRPFDKSMFKVIEKAIIDSEVGIMPENNGEIIRLGIPPLTEERRKQLTKQCSKEAEEAKIAIRNIRRDGVDKLKKAIKDGLSEDLEKDGEADLQKVHDKFIKKVDELLTKKNEEIMTV